MGFIDDILQGGMQGYTAGKQYQRQSMLDQLEQQWRKSRLDMEKANLAFREKQFKAEQFGKQKQDIEKSLEFEDLFLTPAGQAQFGQEPEQALQDIRQIPTNVISKFAGIFEGQPQIAPEAQRIVRPIPGKKAEREQISRLRESQITENLRQAQPRTETLTTAEQKEMAIQDLMKRDKGLSYSESYQQISRGETAQPGYTVDQILKDRMAWVTKSGNEDKPVTEYYRQARINAPATVDSLASVETGLPIEEVRAFMESKDFGEFQKTLDQKLKVKSISKDRYNYLISRARIWYETKRGFFDKLMGRQ